MKSLGKRLLSGLFRNCAHPKGAAGRAMLRMMNRGHRRVYGWTFDACPFADGMRVLDVGCGGGGAVLELRRRFPGIRVDGVDVSAEGVAMCRRAAGGAGRFEIGEAGALPAADGTYDAAYAIETVYFWPDLAAGLREMRRVVRAGGFAAVSVECTDPEKSRVWTDLVGPSMKVRTPGELAEAFRGAGFARVEIREDTRRGLACVLGWNPGGSLP